MADKFLGVPGTQELVAAINANKTKAGTYAEYKPNGIHKDCPYFCTDHNCIYYNGTVYGEPSTVFEIVVDPAEYDNIIDSESGIIKTLTNYTFQANMNRTKLKEHIDRIKFVAFKTADGQRRTYMNITFTMPAYGIFCAYSFNKTDSDHLGVGYATFNWKDENTCRCTSISSTMYIDGHGPDLADMMARIVALEGKPTATEQVQADWNVTSSTSKAYIKNKPTLAAVAKSGSYNDLSNKPDINNLTNRITTLEGKGQLKTQKVDSIDAYKAISSYDPNTLYYIPESED